MNTGSKPRHPTCSPFKHCSSGDLKLHGMIYQDKYVFVFLNQNSPILVILFLINMKKMRIIHYFENKELMHD